MREAIERKDLGIIQSCINVGRTCRGLRASFPHGLSSNYILYSKDLFNDQTLIARFIDALPSMLWTFLAAVLFAYMLAIVLTALVGSDLAPWTG